MAASLTRTALSRTIQHCALRNASTLVLADHANSALAPSTLHTVSAAKALGGDICVLISGNGAADAATEAAQIEGVSRVLVANSDALASNLSENLAKLLQGIQEKESFTHVMGSTSAVAKSTLPRLAALLDVAAITDVTGVESEDTFVRPTYAGNAICRVQSADTVKVLSVRATAFEAAPVGAGSGEVVEADSSESDAALSSWVSESLTKSERPELGAAKVVVSGGRALGSKENFELMYNLADKLGGAVGASRAAVDAGYAPNDLQVGQTGKVVAPDLYLAVGISGAIQHLAGMKDSKVIVAINKDPEAPIFEVADYGLVGDLFDEVPKFQDSV
eukprot:TRINITY_DN4075_c0_g1_i4.p1 TRINITY_DN4075_c0_g1~~TRINITY_DN4075_c0_g1_i4.p1  ORF type:complete len:334 (+),score=115.28 TRINITY_DN4075_c0_g1_i4:139-1140(+)